MFSKIVTSVFAVSFISVTSGFIVNTELRVLEPILKCYETDDSAAVLAFEKATDQERKETYRDDLKLICSSMKTYDSCLVDVIKEGPSPVPIIFYLFAAGAYQSSVLLKKAKLCPDLTYVGLKEITEESGILEDEQLPDIENDKYVKCAGDAVKKCLIHHVDLSQSFEEDVENYANCMKEQAKICPADILRHAVKQVEAYKKHMIRLIKLEKLEN